MKHPIGQTRNGMSVYVDLISSPSAKRIAQHPQYLVLAKEMLAQIKVRGAEAVIEHDMGRLIGYDFVVTTTDKDTVFYGRLIKDTIYTRFTKNGKPLSTNHLTVKLRQVGTKNYELSDIWIGHSNPPRPGSDNETTESKVYWSNHAFVLDGQPIESQTITKICPY
ncbi:MAG TPA: hypothetical protein VFB59_03670 [Candidatus Saccharimonadales bacterium]|nr:hypothetical protein [Candidatus Saccharimonadales bacterium]